MVFCFIKQRVKVVEILHCKVNAKLDLSVYHLLPGKQLFSIKLAKESIVCFIKSFPFLADVMQPCVLKKKLQNFFLSFPCSRTAIVIWQVVHRL